MIVNEQRQSSPNHALPACQFVALLSLPKPCLVKGVRTASRLVGGRQAKREEKPANTSVACLEHRVVVITHHDGVSLLFQPGHSKLYENIFTFHNTRRV